MITLLKILIGGILGVISIFELLVLRLREDVTGYDIFRAVYIVIAFILFLVLCSGLR